MVMRLVIMMFWCLGDINMNVGMVEYFAGEMAVTRAFALSGFRAAPFEIRLLESLDILTCHGPLG